MVKPLKVFGCEENLLILTVLSPLRGFPDTSLLLCCSATLWRLYVIEDYIEKNLLFQRVSFFSGFSFAGLWLLSAYTAAMFFLGSYAAAVVSLLHESRLAASIASKVII